MIHERGYWLNKREVDTHEFDEALAQAIALMFPYKEAVDIGCGNGAYTKYLNDHGIPCTGYDGSPLTPTIANKNCSVRDFAEPQDIGTFPLVLCLEVGEHIPKQYEEVFIDNICRACGKTLVLSWAVTGQPGVGHVNCQDNDYVIGRVTERGFKYKRADSFWLRECSTLPWFANTLMVFRNYENRGFYIVL